MSAPHDLRTPLEVAYHVLLDGEPRAAGALDAVLARRLASSRLERAGRARVVELVRGGLRHRGTLDHLLDQQLRKPRKVDRPSRALLRLGAYQLLMLDGVPDHAVVDGVVRLARRLGIDSRRAGFLNGVLRGLLRRIESRLPPADGAQADGASACVRRVLPRPDGGLVHFAEPVFADPIAEPVAHLAQRYSHPEWLVARWLASADYGRVERRLVANNRRPPISLRVNVGRATRAELLARLSAAGLRAREAAHPQVLLVEGGDPASFAGFAEGLFAVQDSAAVAVAELAPLERGALILELAAAPGGKTMHLLERGEALRLLAVDSSPPRLARLRQNLARLGVGEAGRVDLLAARGEQLPFAAEQRFDGVLADVPCSNTGVIGRRADLRWRLSSGDLQSLIALQAQLIESAANRVRVGGWLIYSTCSVEAEENQQQVSALLARQPAFELLRELATYPESSDHTAGGYAALLRRRPVDG